MDKFLHIVSFNVPLPANYGGVIDVFYKIKALHREGVKIILHCFLYDRSQNPDLEKFCEKIYYYPRKQSLKFIFNKLPYIVSTRVNKILLNNLSADDYPVLFEGIHCCGFLNHSKLQHKKKLVRIHNVEHQYYLVLAQNEKNILKKSYFKLESRKLKKYENHLQNADELLVLSKYDEAYYSDLYQNVNLIPPFHQYQEVKIEENTGSYILFNADFTINFNYQFAKELSKLVKHSKQKLILAGKINFEPNDDLEIIKNPSDEKLDQLISYAFINIISLEHPTGFKLKLVHALHRSKNIVLVGSYIKELDIINCAEVKYIPILENLISCIQEIEKAENPYQEIWKNRIKALNYFNNQQQANLIISIL